jgi:hypothetical protein
VTFNRADDNLDNTGFNDRPQSAQFRGSWRVCEGANYRGTCQILSGNVPNLAAYGLDGTYGPGKPEMPLSLTIGRYLLAEFVPTAFQSIAFDATPEECRALGRSLATQADRVALLVMGDGSACRTEKAPGYLDVRAGPYDEEIARALREADAAALGTLDPVLAQELKVAGRAAWQVLAGAAGETRLTGELLADEAPYGVGYLVASWS